MPKPLRWFLGLIAVLALGWFALVGVVWNRNRVPSLALPTREPMPEGNVYEEYVQCVAAVPQQDKARINEYFEKKTLPAAALQDTVQRNRDLLARFHGLIGKPSLVTNLEPGKDFVPMQDFPYLTGLVVLESAHLRPTSAEAALNSLLNGLTFSEDVMRGGAVINLGAGIMSLMPLVQEIPRVVPALSAEACEQGAKRVRQLIETQYPLTKILEKERLVRVNRLITILNQQSGRALRFQVPSESYEWEYMMRPKSDAVTTLNNYLSQWEQEAEKPFREISPPSWPETLAGLQEDDAVKSDSYGGNLLRYRYKETRLRLIYTALRLEALKKKQGQYPNSLAQLGSDPYFTDPFSGKPFVYRREGSGYVLYSVGPNGQDDGNAPEPPGRSMNPRSPFDIAFEPRFISMSRGARP